MSYTRAQLMEYALSRVDVGDAPDVVEADADIVAFLLDHCTITVPEKFQFFVDVNCEGVMGTVAARRASVCESDVTRHDLRRGMNALAFTGWHDFSHTCTYWEDVLSLGIYGIRARIDEYARRAENDAAKQRFYASLARVWDAALGFVSRAADAADAAGKHDMAMSLRALATRAPETLYEAMQTIVIYYELQTVFDGTYLRTLGRLDSLLLPFYQKEQKQAGTALIEKFIAEIDMLRAPSNMPFALCGTDQNGKELINELTYVILDAYQRVSPNNTKLHILMSPNTPTDVIDNALDGVRHGNNSIVFISDERVIESLVKLGADAADAVNYHVVGCYECGAEGELTCSCNARVNLPKALELCLNGGRDMLTGELLGVQEDVDFATFEQLYAAYERQMTYLCRQAMLSTELHENHLTQLHATPILSATYPSAMERGADLYCGYAAKYNNSSLNAIGLATVVDSLAAIRKLVYEDKTMTLGELIDVLKNDWKDHEALRLRVKNKFPKYGMADATTDALVRAMTDTLAATVSKKPNTKGGLWRLGTFSINWRWEFGAKTAASADGRHAGETLSQNSSATFGADRDGATAHLLSAAAIDTSNTPNGTIVDIDLHESAVKGANGLLALRSSLKAYFAMGGFAVHYNVLDTETLKKAQKTPKDYPNLQVRLCGWNVLFSSLSEKEQNEFIARSEKQGGGV